MSVQNIYWVSITGLVKGLLRRRQEAVWEQHCEPVYEKRRILRPAVSTNEQRQKHVADAPWLVPALGVGLLLHTVSWVEFPAVSTLSPREVQLNNTDNHQHTMILHLSQCDSWVFPTALLKLPQYLQWPPNIPLHFLSPPLTYYDWLIDALLT